MNQPLNLKDFVYLMLASLAQKTPEFSIERTDQKGAKLPSSYKQVIEEILYANSDWKEKFSILINMEKYFENHFNWELRLGLMLEHVLYNELGKKIEYDIVNDSLLISFTQSEIDNIMEHYPDENLQNVMNYFTDLLTNVIYTRQFKERFGKITSGVDTIPKMSDIFVQGVEEELPDGYIIRTR